MSSSSKTQSTSTPGHLSQEMYAAIPSVNEVAESAALADWAARLPRTWSVRVVREVIGAYRKQLSAGLVNPRTGHPSTGGTAEKVMDEIVRRVAAELEAGQRKGLRAVINATGIILHTGLGRAPLAPSAVQAVAETAGQYSNVEVELATGGRAAMISELLTELTGAEAAAIVNNNAAATLLVLVAVAEASGHRSPNVVVSRGELIEIGGSFRLPDIMTASGNLLRETGTTNKTRLSDYEQAINEQTAALLKVHPSNFRVTGFTEETSLGDLVQLGRRRGLPVIHDIGSGAMMDFARFRLDNEPLAKESITEGADLVLFSGDKLLGGPQAGIIVGSRSWIGRIKKNPLMRALRVDKMTLAALEATLRLYLAPGMESGPESGTGVPGIPIIEMTATPLEELRLRAEAIAGALQDLEGIGEIEVVPSVAYLGGGALPEEGIDSIAVRIEPESMTESELAARLRSGHPAIAPRVQDGAVWLEVRTVLPAQDVSLIDAIRAAFRSSESIR